MPPGCPISSSDPFSPAGTPVSVPSGCPVSSSDPFSPAGTSVSVPSGCSVFSSAPASASPAEISVSVPSGCSIPDSVYSAPASVSAANVINSTFEKNTAHATSTLNALLPIRLLLIAFICCLPLLPTTFILGILLYHFPADSVKIPQGFSLPNSVVKAHIFI